MVTFDIRKSEQTVLPTYPHYLGLKIKLEGLHKGSRVFIHNFTSEAFEWCFHEVLSCCGFDFPFQLRQIETLQTGL